MTKTAIREILAGVGITRVVSGAFLATALKVCPRTINNAKLKGELPQVDRATYDIDSIVEWLYANPRYLARLCEKY